MCKKIILFGPPENITFDEAVQSSLLRAYEWGRFPLFATQFIVPVLFIWFDWLKVIISLVLATWIWSYFKYKFVDIRISYLFCYLNNAFFRWGVGIIFGIIYAIRGEWLISIISVFWTIIAILLQFLTPRSKYGVIQKMFMTELKNAEYIDDDFLY